ncbi:uncharacterized protein LODBEIA_P08070 [Lodderomyces beijingensis]|uniref:Coatomer subunit zeta n=1 Tax=Lodderomyces beijingensis TaxID=1775926 RepID=A0ABP0ZEI6_9ASCO
MSFNTTLYTVSALLILDNEGNRLYAKYYTSSLAEPQKEASSTPNSTTKTKARATSSTSSSGTGAQQEQLKSEKTLFSKINKVNQDIILYDQHIICYKQTNDVTIILTAPINENECLIYSTLTNLIEALQILLNNNSVDKQTIITNYDLVTLAIDETIDDGIIIEYDPATIVSRVTNAPVNNPTVVDLKNIDLSEKGLFNALSFAGKKLGERLQQGL